MIHVKVTNKCGMVDVYFSSVHGGTKGLPMLDETGTMELLWDQMPMGMVGIDGDEHADAAMRICASYGDGRNAVDVE